MTTQNKVSINFKGFHFDVVISEEAFLVENIKIKNPQEVAEYIESDLDFEELMLKMVNKLEEREEKQCQRMKKEEKEEKLLDF